MDIFIVEIDADVEESKKYQKKSFTDSAKLKQHCMAYYAADKIMEKVYQIQNREIEYQNNKPVLKTKEKCFSISHSGKFIAQIFSDSNCGIDIEEIKPRKFKEISEKMKFQNCNTLESFYKAWTNYEAKYKLGNDNCTTVNFKNENYQICAACENLDEDFHIYLKKITDFSKS